MDFLAVVTLTGFFGDAFLQILVKKFGYDWGLKSYFEQHGTAEALFLGAGLMAILFIIYIYILKLPLSYTNLAIYGIIIDIIFRKTMVFNTLTDYYNVQNYFETMIIGGSLPAMLPLLIFNIFKN